MLRLFFIISLCVSLFGAEVEQKRWPKDKTYLGFLQDHHLPLRDLYYNLDKDDQILTQEMVPGIHYSVVKKEDGTVDQLLLPLNDELQIHIYFDNGKYFFEIIPIIKTKKTEAFMLHITSSPHYNIIKETHSVKLAKIFISAFQNSLDFKNNIRKGDRLVMIYDQFYRLGNEFSMPILKAAMIEMQGKKHFIYLNYDNEYYNENGTKVQGFLLNMPVHGARISSPFTKRRWHPILKRWKAHLGVDLAIRRGTPVHAAGSGRIIYAARAGSYGNLIKIQHSDGYETRYAHLKSFRRGIRRGKYVKKGEVIAYVGTTGRSTGPHLHFELRKNGEAIDPFKIVQVTKKRLRGRKKAKFLELRDKYNKEIYYHLNHQTKFIKKAKMPRKCYFSKFTLLDENKE
ncbi:Membrane proteins related to metalloendopeptidases [hydrothermal vent metagenome]|uniref:Membrane proteins related to metalloendopeptidases n=1 Tax=hydrothermal vent metagenome TaxID=652676 RepID=A0A1W1BJ76_9ZZZZ